MSYTVTGAAAVAVIDGVDRYYYRGAVIERADNAEHLVEAGLIRKDEQPKPEPKAEPKKA